MPAAPAPEKTTLISSIFLPMISSALSSAAPEMIAVPCWSSWKTGMSQVFFSSSSISKHSGALMSSRLMPPKVGSSIWQKRMISFGSLAVDLDVEDVDVGEALEEHALALHHRLAGERADVAEAEHGGAVGHHRDEVALGGVLVGELGVLGDLETRLGHAGRVGQRKVALRRAGLGRHDLDLAVSFSGVVGQSFFAGDFLHRFVLPFPSDSFGKISLVKDFTVAHHRRHGAKGNRNVDRLFLPHTQLDARLHFWGSVPSSIEYHLFHSMRQ